MAVDPSQPPYVRRWGFHRRVRPAVEATGGVCGGRMRNEPHSDFIRVCVCVCVYSGLRSAEIWGAGSARQLAGSWILSGVHQGS